MVITMKKAVLFFIVVLLVIGVCGCDMKRESKQDIMLNYINEKYDDTFTFKSVFGGSAGSNTKKIIVTSGKFPGEDVYVVCTEIDGIQTFTDNYLGVKFANKTKETLSAQIEQCFGKNFYLSYIPANLACTENGSDQTTFEQYVAEESSFISFEAIVTGSISDSDKDAIIEKIKTAFSNMSAIGRIYFVNDVVDFTAENGRDLFVSCVERKEYSHELYFKCNVNNGITIKEWTE